MDERTGASTDGDETPSLKDAVRDLGWFSGLFAGAVGAPSVLSILQQVFVEHRLTDAFQWIVDGYDAIVGVLAGAVEPLAGPVIAWIGARLDLSLSLHPHWRPLFVLTMMAVMSSVRSVWRLGHWGSAAGRALLFGAVALVSCLSAGLLPLEAGWWAQGATAALPVGLMFVGLLALTPFYLGLQNLLRVRLQTWLGLLAIASAATGVSFLVAAAAAFVPGLQAGAGVLALTAAIVVIGLLFVHVGWRSRNANDLRLGLTTLGGFLLAGLIVAADAAVKALS